MRIHQRRRGDSEVAVSKQQYIWYMCERAHVCMCIDRDQFNPLEKKKSEERDESIGLRVEEAREGEPLA